MLVRVEFPRYIVPSSQQSYVPFAGEVQQDSSRIIPTCDCSHDGTHAFRLVEARGLSNPDARTHAAHWFRAVENHVLSGIQERSKCGVLSRSDSESRAPLQWRNDGNSFFTLAKHSAPAEPNRAKSSKGSVGESKKEKQKVLNYERDESEGQNDSRL